VLVTLRIIPRASKAGLAGVRGDALLIRLTAAPVDGRANEALVELLAKACGLSTRAVTIVQGERSRQKTVRLSGLTFADAAERLGLVIPPRMA
jgi:uncharacterized protein (TIGR00251 family)